MIWCWKKENGITPWMISDFWDSQMSGRIKKPKFKMFALVLLMSGWKWLGFMVFVVIPDANWDLHTYMQAYTWLGICQEPRRWLTLPCTYTCCKVKFMLCFVLESRKIILHLLLLVQFFRSPYNNVYYFLLADFINLLKI